MRVTPFRIALVAAVGSYALLYWGVALRLVQDWAGDDNYSHGFLVVPLATYFIWERRSRLAALSDEGRAWGLVGVAGSLGLLLAGLFGAELFLTRVSMLGVLAGAIVFVLGWRALRVLAFPLAFLMLMVPIPAILFNQVAFPLQLAASQVGETTLSALGVPVLREGNVIVLARTSLEVAEACSGIRSLVSLLTLGILYGYVTDRRIGVRTFVALSTVPIAIVANGARVAGTGVAAHYLGPEAGDGFFHAFSGWIVFMVGLAGLVVVARLLVRLIPDGARQTSATVRG